MRRNRRFNVKFLPTFNKLLFINPILNLKCGTISVLIKQLCMNEYHGEILIGKQSVCDKLMSIQALFTSHFQCNTMGGSSKFCPKKGLFSFVKIEMYSRNFIKNVSCGSRKIWILVPDWSTQHKRSNFLITWHVRLALWTLPKNWFCGSLLVCVLWERL